jgi:Protein of unknown function (DUF4197)
VSSARAAVVGCHEKQQRAGIFSSVLRFVILKHVIVLVCALEFAVPITAFSGQLDKLLREPSGAGLSETKIAAGLKEALQIGAQNAVKLTGRPDGYLGNQAIKIPMPDELRRAERTLHAVGLGQQADDFIVSMNRAAERAAPAALSIFFDAASAMTFEDARRILWGGDTAASQYFRTKTTDKLTVAFRPTVKQAMNEVGVTRQYKALADFAQSLPFVNVDAIDLDAYVVGKTLDGLFHVLGEEERKIRTDPAARVTVLLRDVFGK